jgi:phosphoribosylaminoimidazole-succinocarboxamide synthase
MNSASSISTKSVIPPLLPRTDLDGLTLLRRGKVRDVYEVDAERLLLVSSDRVSAFDFVLEPAIPYKGAVLNAISSWWFRTLGERRARSHFATDRVDEMPEAARRHAATIAGRAVLCRRAKIVPYECVARGYLTGSVVKEYAAAGTIYGEKVGAGLKPGDRLPEPLFTPTTKAESGHDEPVTLAAMEKDLGAARARELAAKTLELFAEASRIAAERGLLLVDTKLEWGLDASGALLLCDEVFTPDSSRYWLADEWKPGRPPESLDKQVVRNYLTHESGWDQKSGAAPPPLPPHIVVETSRRYLRLHKLITGAEL